MPGLDEREGGMMATLSPKAMAVFLSSVSIADVRDADAAIMDAHRRWVEAISRAQPPTLDGTSIVFRPCDSNQSGIKKRRKR